MTDETYMRDTLLTLSRTGSTPVAPGVVDSALRAGRRHARRRRIATGTGTAAALTLVVVGAFALTAGGKAPKQDLGLATLVPRATGGALVQVLPAPVDQTQPTTVQKPPTLITDTSGIPGVRAYDVGANPDGTLVPGSSPGLEHDHVGGPVRYALTPPVGGPHAPQWANAGAYTAPVTAERVVHLLEHGVVWITYRPDLPSAEITKLQQVYADTPNLNIDSANSPRKWLLLSPWVDTTLPAPVVISAWGRQLQVQDAGDPRLARFITAFRNDPALTYEASADTTDQPVAVGGRPAVP